MNVLVLVCGWSAFDRTGEENSRFAHKLVETLPNRLQKKKERKKKEEDDEEKVASLNSLLLFFFLFSRQFKTH